MKRFVLVGGGTGGHFYPLIAVAQTLNQLSTAQHEPYELYYLGPEQYDSSSLQKQEITYIHIPAGKRRRYFSPLNFFDPFKTLLGIFVSLWKLYLLYPDVVFSKGGYTSVPVTLASFLLRIPVVIHESDAKPGSANKLASHFARYIAVAFDDTVQYLPLEKVALTGIPIRNTFTHQSADPRGQLGIPKGKPLIFVTGGSLGAQRINNLILESLDELLPEYTVLHQTGPNNEEGVRNAAGSLISDTQLLDHYYVKGTLTGTEMHNALSAADIVVSRAGSGTLFEIALAGKPSIIIPIPESISHDQRTNAYAYARSGAGSVIEESNLTDGLLASEVHRIMNNDDTYHMMCEAAQAFARADASIVIAQKLSEIAQEHG